MVRELDERLGLSGLMERHLNAQDRAGSPVTRPVPTARSGGWRNLSAGDTSLRMALSWFELCGSDLP